MISGCIGLTIQNGVIIDMISPFDPEIIHPVVVKLAPDGLRRAVWIHPPIPGLGTGHKVFRTERHSLRYAKRLTLQRCPICEAGATHARNGDDVQ